MYNLPLKFKNITEAIAHYVIQHQMFCTLVLSITRCCAINYTQKVLNKCLHF